MANENPSIAGLPPSRDDVAARLLAIERDVDAGRYRPGPWETAVRLAKTLPSDARAQLAEDISRVSRKLHLRIPRRTIPLAVALAIELAGAALGGIFLLVGLRTDSTGAAVAAMIIWVIALQPLVKVGAGTMLGIGYDYGYLYGVEPRFKMKFGSYVAASRWKRVVLHAAGMVGSPLGALLVARSADGGLPVARLASLTVLWIVVAINLNSLFLAMLGFRRLGPMRLADGSGGAMGFEMREALGGLASNRRG